jgi:hypothetical protein
MEILIIILSVLSFLGWICYHLQKKIGEDQVALWEDFKKKHPEYFNVQKRPVKQYLPNWSEKKKKEFLEGIWARYNTRHQHYNEPKRSA